jgi:TIR domain-containing protein
MAYVPGCRHDLFISYASSNNRDGWVEHFEKALGQELHDLLGRAFVPKESVYFDKRELEVAQSFPEELAAAARNSAVLVPILSPGYLTSPWCYREGFEFFSKLPHGAAPENCLAPILIRPIDEVELDSRYRHAQRLSFLSADGQSPFASGSPEWTARIRILAGQLKNALKRLRRVCKPVFVGKGASTERVQNLRTWCCAELERRNFRTVPEFLQTLDETDAVRKHLQEAGMAVHFLGGSDESALDAIGVSVEVCPGPTILYQPFGVALAAHEQMWLPEFERQLTSGAGRYQRLQGKNDQELIALLDEQITRSQPSPEAEASQLELALVCEDLDLAGVRLLKDEIRALQHITVDFPSFLGTRLKAMERLRKWREFLKAGQILVFYHGLTERERLQPIWLQAEQDNGRAVRTWFLAPPDLEVKRQNNPDALWHIDQVIQLVQGTQR